MPTRDHAPIGSPCWVDLWTSDVDGSRKFYAELLGWEAQEPSPEFGGYFMFTREGVPVAGAMGDMGDMLANNTWKIYFATGDIDETLKAAEAEGAQTVSPAMPVADLGIQAVVTDPSGAHLGFWQPGTFPGFTVLAEPGAPTWFELYTRDYAGAVAFYRSIFPLEMKVVSDSDEFRYTTLNAPDVEGELGGIMDATGFIPDGAPPYWSVYWGVDDTDTAVARVQDLGGTVLMEATDSPYGRLATVTDPAGAQFRLIAPNP